MAELDYQYLARLVVRAQVGDSDAFAELYVATYQKQYRFACKYLRDEYLAQDAIQETYTLALKNIRSLKDPMVFISWLNQINMRVCFKLQAVQKTYADHTTALEDGYRVDVTPETTTIRIDENNYILRQVMSLPFSEAQAIIFRYYNNLKIDEIAKLMDISRSSVKRYLKSGQQKLSRMIQR